MTTKIPLLYIGSSSHSGSTLLDLLLGSHPQIESVGEAKKIAPVAQRWRAGERPLCTCRKPIGECNFWGDVLPAEPQRLKTEALANADFFRRVLLARGRQIALDSSKSPGRARMLAHSGLFDLTFIHLVRDSRAVAYSHRRKHPAGGRAAWVASACRWQQLNLRARRLFRRREGVVYYRVRYEDLAADPQPVLQDILSRAGLDWHESLLRYREHTHHNIEGNRMRLGIGSEIRIDDEYLRRLSRTDWWLATLPSWRGLRAFGYPWKRSPVAAAPGGLRPSFS